MHILMIIAMMGWGLVWALSKFLLDFGEPAQIAALRYIIVCISFVPLMYVLKVSFVIPKNALIPTLLTSLFNTIYAILMYAGMQYGDAGSAGVIAEVLAPIMAAFLYAGIKKQRLFKNEIWGLVIGVVAGGFLVNVFSNPSGVFSYFNIIYVLAAFVWALLMISSRYATESLNAISLNFYTSLLSALILFPSLFLGHKTLFEILDSGVYFWVALLGAAIFCTVFSTTIFYKAIFVLGVTKGGIYALLVPIFALFFAWIILGEIPKSYTIIGGILAILAIYIINYYRGFGQLNTKKNRKSAKQRKKNEKY